MGLLDEAIRDHLELKRRRGADPAEVAREQHEALDSVPDGAPTGALEVNGEDAMQPGAPDEPDDLAEPAPDHVATDAQGELSQSLASEDASAAGGEPGMEETAELDMNAVLQEELPPEPQLPAAYSREGDVREHGSRGAGLDQ